MQARLRYWIRLLVAFVARFKVVLFVGVVLGLFLFVLAGFVFGRMRTDNVEYVGVAGRYHTDELPKFVLGMLGDGLTRATENGQLEAALAERWEANSDGTEWTFYLKQDLVWHDGTKVNSESVQYSFEDTVVERPDEYTIKFKLSSPFSPFPSVVSRPTFKKGLLGTGEWRVANLHLNGSYVQELVLANENRDKKIFRFFPTEDGARIAYQLGQVDKLLDTSDPSPFDTWNNSNIERTVRRDRVVALFFNNESAVFKGPENKPLRQALSYAIEKDNIDGPRAIGPVSPTSWAFNPLIKDYAYDSARAKELIADFPDGVKVGLVTGPTLLPIAEKVANYWREVGVEADVHVEPVLPEEYDAFLAVYDIPLDPDQYPVWHTTQTRTNVSKYSNPRIDKLLEDGRVELDPEERKKIYLDFQRFLLEDAPAVFLYHPVSYTVTRK